MEKCDKDIADLIIEQQTKQFACEKEQLEAKIARLRREAHELAKEVVRTELAISTPGADLLMEAVSDDPDTALSQLTQMLERCPKSKFDILVCLSKIIGQKHLDNEKVITLLRKALEDNEPSVRERAVRDRWAAIVIVGHPQRHYRYKLFQQMADEAHTSVSLTSAVFRRTAFIFIKASGPMNQWCTCCHTGTGKDGKAKKRLFTATQTVNPPSFS